MPSSVKRGLAAQRLQDAVIFLRRDAVVAKHFWSDGGFFGEAGSAFNWVHGEGGSSIVARGMGLGKDFGSLGGGRMCVEGLGGIRRLPPTCG